VAESLCRLFSIDARNLEARRRLVGLHEDERRLLAGLVPWAKRVAPAMASEFYDRQFGDPDLLAWMERYARENAKDLQQMRSGLERAMAGYIVEIYTGAEDNWGLEYFERRLRVGMVHDQIDLPFKHYLGMYPTHFTLTRKYLRRSFWLRPRYVGRVEEAVLKVYNLDQQAVGDAFLLSMIRSTRFEFTSVKPPEGGDLSEAIGPIKRRIAQATSGLGTHLGTVSSAANGLRSMSDALQAGTEQTLSQTRQLSTAAVEMEQAIAEIARSAARAASVAAHGSQQADRVNEATAELGRASDEIGEVVRTITTIASRTNLLSLNASIEAARAGDAGKGFQVVAREVKDLAAKTASSTGDISARIERIQTQVANIRESIQEITGTVQQVNELQQTIAGAVEEQSNTTREITRHVRDLTAAAESSATQVLHTSESAHQLSRTADELGEAAQSFAA
jgi:Methyl-accepting chemotaxis protein (MCP) signalling domain/Protoglobin